MPQSGNDRCASGSVEFSFARDNRNEPPRFSGESVHARRKDVSLKCLVAIGLWNGLGFWLSGPASVLFLDLPLGYYCTAMFCAEKTNSSAQRRQREGLLIYFSCLPR